MDQNTVKIGVGVFSLKGIGGHLVIGVTDQSNRVIAEFNGLATDKYGNEKAMGLPWQFNDTIKAYDHITGMYARSAYKVGLGQYTPEQYQAMQQKIYSTMDVINAQNLDYKMMSQNSNSVARTILESLGLAPPVGQLNKLPIPGYSNILADPDFISDMQDQHCFLAGTEIDMWPVEAVGLTPDKDGKFDQEAVRAAIWKKPIEQIQTDDWVVSFSDDGLLIPGKVGQTFQNRSKHILDVPVPQFDDAGKPNGMVKSLM